MSMLRVRLEKQASQSSRGGTRGVMAANGLTIKSNTNRRFSFQVSAPLAKQPKNMKEKTNRSTTGLRTPMKYQRNCQGPYLKQSRRGANFTVKMKLNSGTFQPTVEAGSTLPRRRFRTWRRCEGTWSRCSKSMTNAGKG